MLSANQIKTLQYSTQGSPRVKLAVKPAVPPNTLALSDDGSPWYALSVPTTYPLTIDNLTINISFGTVTLFYNTAKPISIVQPYITVYMWKRTS